MAPLLLLESSMLLSTITVFNASGEVSLEYDMPRLECRTGKTPDLLKGFLQAVNEVVKLLLLNIERGLHSEDIWVV